MSVIQQSLLRLSKTDSNSPAWLRDIQQRGRSVWGSHHWPTKKTEDWRYTNLSKLEKSDFFAGTHTVENIEVDSQAIKRVVDSAVIPELSACRLVFVDGQYDEGLSDGACPPGLNKVLFSEADSAQVERIQAMLGSVVESGKHLFTSLNELQLNEGLYLGVEKNTAISKALHIVYVSTGSTSSVNQRLLVDMAESSEFTVIEHFVSLNDAGNSFNNGASEFCLAGNAKLTHYRLNLETENSLHVGGVHAALERSAQLSSFYLALGSALKRIDVVVKFLGEGAHADVNGVYLPKNNQHVDFHTNLEHCVPNTTSNEVFRGIIGDTAKAVFNGRIHIYPQAQKTHAQLSNKNLLTSDKAEVNTKPELEIYANDVLCAHGATVAQLNDESMHYLRTRGVSTEEAQVMLSFGFINELIEKLDDQAISDYLRPVIAGLFARDSDLTRHLL